MAGYVTDGSGNIQMHGIASHEPMEIFDEYVDVAREIRDQSMTHMDQLGHENEMLKTLLSDLHKYVTSHSEINDSPFERALKLDPPVHNLYRQAQDIYHFLKTTKEIERETASSSKQLLELLSLITGDGEHHKTIETEGKGRTRDVSQSFLEESDRQKKSFQHALSVLEQIKQRQQHMDRLGNENESLKTLLSNLHKYVTSHTEINESPFELSSAIEPDPPVANLFRQAQDVYQFLKETKERARHVDRMGNENEILKTLLSDLHKYVTPHMEINDSPFELSSTLRPDPPVANLYKQAQEVYHFLKEAKKIESETASVNKQLLELLSIIIGDGEHHKTYSTGRERGTTNVSHSLLQQSDSQKERFKSALYVLEQMKETQKECEKMQTIIFSLQESLSEKDNDWNTLNKAWQGTYTKLQEEKERELDHKEKEWVQYCKSLTQQHEKEKEQLHNTLERLNSEKDNLLTRLSVIAADRLTHGNVNIADLSDPNRPTKLQEVYSELYDNEWTDAFQELTGHPNVSDKDAIRILLDILMCSFQRCREITWDRYKRLKYVASSVEIIKRNPLLSDVKVMSVVSEHGLAKEDSGSTLQLGKTDATVDQRFGCTLDLDINLKKQIKDIWRATTVALKEHAIKQLPSIIEAFLDMPCSVLPMTSKYLSICIDLCWNMGIQEKPLHLDNVSEKRFDKEKFKTYTHSGENVEFVVWPALFLYEGGPILSRGIAQGCSSDGKETNAVYV